MKKVLIHCEKKFKDSLLNNSPIFNNKSYYDCNDLEIENVLKENNITILSKKEKIDNSFEYDFIIIDELLNYEVENKTSIYYFIPPIDFNIADPFISDRWPRCLQNSSHPNKVSWCNEFYTNLIFLGSNIFESPNQIFDLSLVLNLNNHTDNWGIYHYLAKDLFKAVERKPYRLDYTFREVKKENRVKFFIKLLENLSETELNKIKISAHGSFLRNPSYNLEVKDFFNSQNLLSTFLEFERIDEKFFSFDILMSPTAGYNSWATNKLFLNTFSSDIAVYFETARETEGILNTMNDLITEKTIDLLNVGKPFIHLSKNVEIFLQKYGFKNYNKQVFDLISEDRVELIKVISSMEDHKYDSLLTKLTDLVGENLKIIEKYYRSNTFLFNLIHN